VAHDDRGLALCHTALPPEMLSRGMDLTPFIFGSSIYFLKIKEKIYKKFPSCNSLGLVGYVGPLSCICLLADTAQVSLSRINWSFFLVFWK
jgi:hypothetical protein